MMNILRSPVRFLITILLVSSILPAQETSWQKLDEGLHYAEFDSPQKSTVGDSKITIIKIDPENYDFKLLMASEHGGTARSIQQWAEEYQLIAVVNAGMYQKDYLASVGYMKSYQHINNPNLNKNNAIFAFNAKDSTVKTVQIIDRTCQDFNELKDNYHSFVQSIRMVSCKQENVWAKQPTQWSVVALGIDKNNHVLFMFSRSPYAVHDFINILLALPISLYNAMYLEGGSKAGLYLSADSIKIEKFGGYEDDVTADNHLRTTWPIPNVLGIVKKKKK
jgi:uncharacterized protein YigE (DUF2233 family)